MSKRTTQFALAMGIVALCVVLWFAGVRPGYFANPQNLGVLLLLEGLFVSVWMYRRFFFTILVLSFLFVGVDLPVGGIWTMARWVTLSVGAFVGLFLMIRTDRRDFKGFHVFAFLAVLAALVSSTVSTFEDLSLLKVLSLFLLFLYAATGARLAVMGRENRFFAGLLLGCEIFVGVVGLLHFAGKEVMGHPNSLGAVMGVVAAPILLWGSFVRQEPLSYWRRTLLYALSMYLTFISQARAGMLAAIVSTVLLCVSLRRYAFLARCVGIVAVLTATVAISQPQVFQREMDSFTSAVLFKGQDPQTGILSSRVSPWHDSMESIQNHFWFGTGFGTSDTGHDASALVTRFESNTSATTEHGSSYLALASWVGVAGILPFVLLVGSLLRKIAQSVIWMYRTADPGYGFVPLAMVTLAGLVHAGLEDWLFAPGYYLCVFFWSVAFIFIDQASVIDSFRVASPAQREVPHNREYQIPVSRS